MKSVMPLETVADWSSLAPGASIRPIWSCAVLMLCLSTFSSALSGQSAQSEDQMITALKRGESTYFTAKMRNLSEQLHLDQNQQRRLRPIAEQETAYIEQIRMNPVISRKEKLQRLQEILKDSDTQMKRFLSAQQWQKLRSLRKEQKTTLDNYVNTK